MRFVIPILLLVSAVSAFRDHCESFKLDGPPFVRSSAATVPADLEHVALVASTYYENTARVNLSSSASLLNSDKLVGFCRVELSITTNKTSGNVALTEVWLPDDWNHRILGVGNGGWAGGIFYDSLAFDGVGRGFASFATNTGHTADTLDGRWVENNPNALVDFGWRAMHLSVIAAKAVTASFYGQPARKSYYLGASTGGRQGLTEVQDFPEDFDGVVIGCPANPWSSLMPGELRSNVLMGPPEAPTHITGELWPVIHEEVLRQCDGLDGVMDGVIANPRTCDFRPEGLACGPSSNSSTCLTGEQINTLHKLYSDWTDDDSGFIYGGFQPGGELLYYGSNLGISLITGPPFPIADHYYKYAVLNDSTWDYRTLNASVIKLGRDINPGRIDARKTDLSAFAARGGKLIHYHGLADEFVSPGFSRVYFNQVAVTMRSLGETNVDSFYQFYEIPGLAHASYNGQGVAAFGAPLQAAFDSPPPEYTALYSMIEAVIKWVEEDEAPVDIIGTKWTNNNATLGWEYTRRLCPYPLQAIYVGGDEKSWESFECR